MQPIKGLRSQRDSFSHPDESRALQSRMLPDSFRCPVNPLLEGSQHEYIIIEKRCHALMEYRFIAPKTFLPLHPQP